MATVAILKQIVEKGIQAAEGVAVVEGVYDTVKAGGDFIANRLRKRPAIVTPDKPAKRSKVDPHNSNNPGPNKGVPPNTSSTGLAMANAGTGDHEVSVVPPPKRIALSCPDYFTIDLPWCENGYAAFTRTSNQVTPSQVQSYRLNSIYDPLKIDNGTASTSSGAAHQPMGRDTWAAVYQYYRVLRARFQITVWNVTTVDQTAVNDQDMILAGIEWTDDDTSTGKAQTIQAFMEEKQSDWQFVAPVKGNQMLTGSPVHFSYDYSPEQWQFHVQNSADDNRWTAIDSDPTLPHLINFSIFPFLPGSTSSKAYRIQYHTKIVYTVQFREANYASIQTSH